MYGKRSVEKGTTGCRRILGQWQENHRQTIGKWWFNHVEPAKIWKVHESSWDLELIDDS
jgi:hypothetical protein